MIIGNVNVVGSAHAHNATQNVVLEQRIATFRRSFLISFFLLFLLYKVGVFYHINHTLSSFNNSTTLDGTLGVNNNFTMGSSGDLAVSSGKRQVMVYGEASDTFPPEWNHFEFPPSRKGKCIAVVGLHGTGNVWMSFVAHELLSRSGAEDLVWGVNRGWFSRKGPDYDSTIKLLQHENVVIVSVRYDDLVLGQADVVLDSYRDFRDYVAFQKISKKTDAGAFDSLSKGFAHVVEWHTYATYSMRFEDAVKNKLKEIKNIAKAMGFTDLTDSDIKKISDAVDTKMMASKEHAALAIHSANEPHYVGSYKTSLEPETVLKIETEFKPWLLKYNYAVK